MSLLFVDDSAAVLPVSSSIELELPAFWIDEVVYDDLNALAGTDFLTIINRDAEPGETQVRTDADIAFELASNAVVDPGDVEVWISTGDSLASLGAEALVWDGATFQTGWDGSGSATSNPTANTLRFVIDPTTDFVSLQYVQVRIHATNASGLVDEIYSFRIEDLVAPLIESVDPMGKQTLRIRFNEPMDTDTIVVDNIGFLRLDAPAVWIEPVSVIVVDPYSVDVVTDIEMTPGASYRVTLTGATDVFGNEIEAPANTYDFLGYTPLVPGTRSFQLYKQLAQKNRDEDSTLELKRFVLCLQEVTDLLLCQIDSWTQIVDVDSAPKSFVDAMLQDLGNPFEFDLTLVQKRKLVQTLVSIYKQKGTAVGIINVIRFFLGIEVEIETFVPDGWELGIDELGDTVSGDGDPPAELGTGDFNTYSFVVISPQALTTDERETLISIVDYMKPAHTHLVEIQEPEVPDDSSIDHVELGLSELDTEWLLH